MADLVPLLFLLLMGYSQASIITQRYLSGPTAYNQVSQDDNYIYLEDGNETAVLIREKRAVGTDPVDTVFTLEDVASQSLGLDQFDIGDSVTIKATLDLPGVTSDQMGDVHFEAFGLNADKGVHGFHICKAHLDALHEETNVESAQATPIYSDYRPPTAPTLISKSSFLFELVHTSGEETTGDENKIVAKFQAVMADLDSGSPILSGSQYYVTAGISFAHDEYVWIGQKMVTTQLLADPYAYDISVSEPNTTLGKGHSVLLNITAFVTNPVGDVELIVYQPLGYNDIFHIGKISKTVGNAFACSDEDFWEEEYVTTPSKLSNNRASLRYPSLINREADRNVEDPANAISFFVPVSVVNLASAPVGHPRLVTVAFRAGEEDAYTSNFEFTIGEVVEATSSAAPAIATPVLYNNVTDKTVVAGNAIIFRLLLTCEPLEWCNLDIEMTGNEQQGLYAVGTRFIDTSYLGYIPPEFLVTSRSGDQLLINYGVVYNPSPEPSFVIMEAIFSTDPLHDGGIVDFPGTQTVAGVSMNLPGEGDVTIEPKAPEEKMEIDVTSVLHAFPAAVHNGGQMALEVEIQMPPTSGFDGMMLTTGSDLDVTEYGVRLCALDVRRVGDGLPCLDLADATGNTVFGNGSDASRWEDVAKVDLDRACPANYPGETGNGGNVFNVRAVYEIPHQQADIAALTSPRYALSASITQGQNVLWMISNVYEVDSTNITTYEAYNLIYLGCYSTAESNILSTSKGTQAENTPELCAELCINTSGGMQLSGTEEGDKCFCAGKSDAMTALMDERRVPEEDCSAPCEGDETQVCGNTDRISIYMKNMNVPAMKFYPIISTRDPFKSAFDYGGDVFFIQYLLKPKPMTRGGTVEFVVEPADSPNNNFKVCSLQVPFVGKNFPCVALPTADGSGYSNVDIQYGDSPGEVKKDCGLGAKISFHGLTNWGGEVGDGDLAPDDDSIQIVAFFSTCYVAETAPMIAKHSFQVADVSPQVHKVLVEDTASVDSSGSELVATDIPLNGVTFTAIAGDTYALHMNAPKVLRVTLDVSNGYSSPTTVRVTNLHYADLIPKVVDLCSAALMYAGDNVPCLDLWEKPTVTRSPAPEDAIITENGKRLFESLEVHIPNICHVQYSPLPEANYVKIDLVVRLGKDELDDDLINLQIEAYPTATPEASVAAPFEFSPDLGYLAFSSSLANDASIGVTPLGPEDVFVEPFQNDPPPKIKTGRANREWVSFNITMPPHSVAPVKVAALGEVRDGVAVLTVTDIAFGDGAAANDPDPPMAGNCPCAVPSDDFIVTYATNFSKSEDIKTFMQQDGVTSDLGYVVNTGWSDILLNHKPEDDSFILMLEVEMSDSVDTIAGQTFQVMLAVDFGNVTVINYAYVESDRPATAALREELEQGDILIVANQTEPVATQFEQQETMEIVSVIRHTDLSTAEGYPGIVRVIAPSYMHFVVGQDTFATNYTAVANASDPAATSNVSVVLADAYANSPVDPDHHTFDFVFLGGITYWDVISLNFTLTVDPEEQRKIGSGVEASTVIMVPVCERNVFSGYPADDPGVFYEHQTQCGSHVGIGFSSLAPECFEAIPMNDPDCIWGSSQYSTEYPPSDSLVDDPNKGWIAAARQGNDWSTFLEYDFRLMVRLNKITLGQPTAINGVDVRPAWKIRVLFSRVPGFVENELLFVDVEDDNEIILEPALETRYLKLVVAQAADGTPDTMPIGMNAVKFTGCYAKGVTQADRDAVSCAANPKTDNHEPLKYRHFAWDGANQVLYFCDKSPSAPLDAPACFASRRNVTNPDFDQLPPFITSVRGVGTLPAPFNRQGTVLADAAGNLYGTLDGERVAAFSPAPGAEPSDLEAAKDAPGVTRGQLAAVVWGDGKYLGDFDGIKENSDYIVQWKICCDES